MAVKLSKTSRLVTNANGVSSVGVVLPQRRERKVQLFIESRTGLISHAWSEKASRMMLDKQMGIASAAREKKDPFKDFEASLYRVEGGGFGMPAPAFKACSVTAANDVGLKMTEMRRAFHVNTYTVRIKGPQITKPITEWDEKYKIQLVPYHAEGISMRMDMVRLESGVADIRFRGWWPVWSCTLEVEFNEGVISLEQLVNLFSEGGYGVGIGEWRPSSPYVKSGEFGRFKIAKLPNS